MDKPPFSITFADHYPLIRAAPPDHWLLMTVPETGGALVFGPLGFLTAVP
jgi:hypothetical protein